MRGSCLARLSTRDAEPLLKEAFLRQDDPEGVPGRLLRLLTGFPLAVPKSSAEGVLARFSEGAPLGDVSALVEEPPELSMVGPTCRLV